MVVLFRTLASRARRSKTVRPNSSSDWSSLYPSLILQNSLRKQWRCTIPFFLFINYIWCCLDSVLKLTSVFGMFFRHFWLCINLRLLSCGTLMHLSRLSGILGNWWTNGAVMFNSVVRLKHLNKELKVKHERFEMGTATQRQFIKWTIIFIIMVKPGIQWSSWIFH